MNTWWSKIYNKKHKVNFLRQECLRKRKKIPFTVFSDSLQFLYCFSILFPALNKFHQKSCIWILVGSNSWLIVGKCTLQHMRNNLYICTICCTVKTLICTICLEFSLSTWICFESLAIPWIGQRGPWSDYTDALADLSLRLVHMS